MHIPPIVLSHVGFLYHLEGAPAQAESLKPPSTPTTERHEGIHRASGIRAESRPASRVARQPEAAVDAKDRTQ
jgi:hypothetical protein